MYSKEGFWGIIPEIKSVSFPQRGRFSVELVDGRIIVMPISAFPCLKKVPVKDRKNWYLIGNGVTWDACPEVIHIEQILGDLGKYKHEQGKDAQGVMLVSDDSQIDYQSE